MSANKNSSHLEESSSVSPHSNVSKHCHDDNSFATLQDKKKAKKEEKERQGLLAEIDGLSQAVMEEALNKIELWLSCASRRCWSGSCAP